MSKLKKIIDELLKNTGVYFYTIDHLFKKIVIFVGEFIIEVSIIDKGNSVKKGKTLFFYIRKFNNINIIYNFINEKQNIKDKNINLTISNILKYENDIFKIFQEENNIFFQNTFNKINTNKNVLFILKGGGMEETIEKSFISFCNNSGVNLTVLYKYGTGYWGQQLNQDGFFNELKANNPSVKFLYKEDFDDNFIDSIVDNYTEIFSFQYNYQGKYNGLNMIVLSSVSEEEIDCSKYKNIFSCYKSNFIGYSTDKFINTENTNIYKIFNPQNIDLMNNYSILNKIDNFILSGGMSWARDFSILNSLEGKYKGVLISDEVRDVENFISMYRGIQSYYGFLGVFKLSNFGVFCHLDKFNNDDRSKMIATCICAGKPVVIPYNDGLIVKEVLDNKLGVVYQNGNKKDFMQKIRFFSESDDNVKEYGKNCLNYSRVEMDVNKFINFIFEKTFY